MAAPTCMWGGRGALTNETHIPRRPRRVPHDLLCVHQDARTQRIHDSTPKPRKPKETSLAGGPVRGTLATTLLDGDLQVLPPCLLALGQVRDLARVCISLMHRSTDTSSCDIWARICRATSLCSLGHLPVGGHAGGVRDERWVATWHPFLLVRLHRGGCASPQLVCRSQALPAARAASRVLKIPGLVLAILGRVRSCWGHRGGGGWSAGRRSGRWRC